MEKNIEISNEANFDLEFKEGKLMLKCGYDGKGLDAGLYIELEADYFLDKLAEKIPGKLDDTVIAMLKGALK